MYTKNAYTNLKNRYASVLKKCALLNVFGSLALASFFTLSLGASVFMPTSAEAITLPNTYYFLFEEDTGASYESTFSLTENNVTTKYGLLYQNLAKTQTFSDINSLLGNIIPHTEAGRYQVFQGTGGTIPFSIDVNGVPTDYSVTPDTSSSAARIAGLTADVGTSSAYLSFYNLGSASDLGGAIYNNQNISAPDIYADFFKNTASSGGAIYNHSSPNATMGNISGTFIANSATEEGGAIRNTGGGSMGDITGIFIANTAQNGGAIDNLGTMGTISGTFIANEANAGDGSGGAILNRASATLEGIEGVFIANTALYFGGAIGNYATITNNIVGSFIGNSSDNFGGAINNEGRINGSINAHFIGNTAGGNGGAIFTLSSLTFLADSEINVFTNNRDSTGYNAIYVTGNGNDLTFNMENNGGFLMNDSIRTDGIDKHNFIITGQDALNNVFYLNNTALDVSDFSLDKAQLYMSSVTQGSTTSHGAIKANAVTISGDSILTLNAPSYTTSAAFQGSGSSASLTVGAGAKLQIAGGASGDIVKVVSGFNYSNSVIAAGAWDEDNLTSTSSLQIAKVADYNPTSGSYSILLGVSAADTILQSYPQMQRESAEILSAFSQIAPSVNSPEVFKNLFARIFDNNYIGDKNPWLATLTFEGLMQLGLSAGTSSNALNLQKISLKALHTRLNNFLSGQSTTIVYSDDSAQTGMSAGGLSTSGLSTGGLSAGSENVKNGLAVWATPFYSNSHISNFDAGSFDTAYDSNLGGLSFGVDYTFNNMYRLGLALNGGGGSSESTGDFNTTVNDFGFMNASLYTAIYVDNLTLTADMGLSFVYNEVEHELPTILGYSEAKADINNTVFTIGAEASYLFETQMLDIMPYMGLRYTNIITDSYDVEVIGSKVLHTSSENQEIFSIPLGVMLSKDFVTASNWNITPSLALGMTYSFGDLKASTTTSIPSVIRSATYHVRNIDDVAFNGGIGLRMAKNNISFGFNYDVLASAHEMSHNISASFRYEF